MTPVPASLAQLEQESPQAARLAELVSLAVRVDAGLLRRFRTAFLPDAAVHVESQLWFSPIVESRGPSGFQMSPAVLQVLRERLAATPAGVLPRVRALLEDTHVNVSSAIKLEETVNGIAVERGENGKPEIEAEIRKALRTLLSDPAEARNIARWALHAAARVHPVVRDTAAARALFLSASMLLRMPGPAQTPASLSLSIADLAWSLQGLPSLPTTQLSVAFVTGGIQFRAPKSEGDRITLPATDPLLVQIEWSTGSGVRRELREAGPDVLISLDGDPAEVTLTTLAGDVYQLESSGGEVTGQAQVIPPLEFLSTCERLRKPGESAASCTAFAVAPDILITSRHAAQTPYLLGEDGQPYFVLAWQAGESDEGREDELVALRPAESLVTPLLVPDDQTLPPGELRVRIPGYVVTYQVWRDAVLLPATEGSSLRRGVVHLASGDDVGALSGSPVFLDDRLVGAVAKLTAVSVSSAVVHIEVASAADLRRVIDRARPLAERHASLSARAFVSATADVASFVEVARDALLRLGHVPVRRFEPQRPQSSTVFDGLALIKSCDIYVGVIGWEYGAAAPVSNLENLSIIELEVQRARATRKPIVIFLASPDLLGRAQVDEKQFRFRGALVREHIFSTFSSAEELRDQISAAMTRWQRERDSFTSQKATTPDRIERLAVDIRHTDGRFEFRATSSEFSMEPVPTAERARIDDLLSKAPPFALGRRLLETISDMLVPPQLRAALSVAARVELHPDAACAPYPWELLLADMSTDPPSGSLAMTRWPDPGPFREMQQSTRPRVLGLFAGADSLDPTAFKTLEKFGFKVDLIRATNAKQAIAALNQGEYSCIYVAGPPVFVDDARALTQLTGDTPGVSFGDAAITSREFAALRRKPQLVFVQLRHAQEWRRLQEFAAQVASGLFTADVSAVVCSGWVTELPGTTAFVEGFFADPTRPFASAVREGRRRTLTSGAPLDWAAFHCYGAPNFTLTVDQAAGASGRVAPSRPRPTGHSKKKGAKKAPPRASSAGKSRSNPMGRKARQPTRTGSKRTLKKK